MIKIPANITIGVLEDLYAQLKESDESSIDLILPTNFRNSGFSLLFSYLQFVGTWIRSNRSGRLVLPVITGDEAKGYVDDNDFVYPSIVLSWEKEIVGREGKNLKSDLKEISKKYFNKMEFFDLKGLSVPIYCFDHDKSNRGLSKTFYRNNRDYNNEEAVSFNLYRGFQKIGSHNVTVFREGISKKLDAFMAIIHELFTNTHEHARTNELGYILYPNIRALHLKFHKKTLASFSQEFAQNQGLVSYFNSGFELNKQNELYLLEISILDSGPGLVKRFSTGREESISVATEVEIIKKCLYRHNTSTQGILRETKGLGLDRVLQTLSGKGFCRIKTGRADVFRDMKNNEYQHTDNAEQIQLNDFVTDSTTDFREHPNSVGTLISIFFPLSYLES